MTKFNRSYSYRREHPDNGGFRTYYAAPRANNTPKGGTSTWIMFGPRHMTESQARDWLEWASKMDEHAN